MSFLLSDILSELRVCGIMWMSFNCVPLSTREWPPGLQAWDPVFSLIFSVIHCIISGKLLCLGLPISPFLRSQITLSGSSLQRCEGPEAMIVSCLEKVNVRPETWHGGEGRNIHCDFLSDSGGGRISPSLVTESWSLVVRVIAKERKTLNCPWVWSPGCCSW